MRSGREVAGMVMLTLGSETTQKSNAYAQVSIPNSVNGVRSGSLFSSFT